MKKGYLIPPVVIGFLILAGVLVLLPKPVDASDWIDLTFLGEFEAGGDPIYGYKTGGNSYLQWTCYTDGTQGSNAHLDEYNFWYVDGDGDKVESGSTKSCGARATQGCKSWTATASGTSWTCGSVDLDSGSQQRETQSSGSGENNNYEQINKFDKFASLGQTISFYIGVENPTNGVTHDLPPTTLRFENSDDAPIGWTLTYVDWFDSTPNGITAFEISIEVPQSVQNWPLITITHECITEDGEDFSQTTEIQMNEA